MPPPRTTAKLRFPVLQVDLLVSGASLFRGREAADREVATCSERSRTILNPTKDFFESLVKKLQIPYLCEVSSNLIKTREAPYANRS